MNDALTAADPSTVIDKLDFDSTEDEVVTTNVYSAADTPTAIELNPQLDSETLAPVLTNYNNSGALVTVPVPSKEFRSQRRWKF